jgi:hypothetical protein
MDPRLWGPHLWYFLHTISFQFPVNPTWTHKKEMSDFLISLQYILPCEHCQFHYKNYLLDYPPTLENQTQFIMWVINLHNNINIRLGKPQKNYKEVIEFYQQVYDGKRLYQPPPKSITEKVNEFYKKGFIFLGILCIVLLFFVMMQIGPRVSKLR